MAQTLVHYDGTATALDIPFSEVERAYREAAQEDHFLKLIDRGRKIIIRTSAITAIFEIQGDA